MVCSSGCVEGPGVCSEELVVVRILAGVCSRGAPGTATGRGRGVAGAETRPEFGGDTGSLGNVCCDFLSRGKLGFCY